MRKIIYLVFLGLFLSACVPLLGAKGEGKYEMITVSELQNLIETEEFTFVNVHIPLDGNIPSTDAEIPFDEIENYLDLLPENKDEKIVLYCRSGSMGNTASQTLVDLGYSDVSNLEGGYNVWKSMNLPFEE